MEARLIDTTSTAHDDALAHCLIAIELSKASWVVRQTCKSSLDSPHTKCPRRSLPAEEVQRPAAEFSRADFVCLESHTGVAAGACPGDREF